MFSIFYSISKSKCYFPILRCNIHIYSYIYSYIR